MTHVDPDIAVAAMVKLWRNLGNEPSSPLLSTWRSMCDAFNQAGQAEQSVGWAALAMPTGIGKTLFAALYCALMPNVPLSPYNYRSVALHPGVLFVTRFIAEANKFVERVNELAGRKIAAAYYHNSPMGLAQAQQFPILVITHAACERHQLRGTAGSNGDAVWDQLMAWHQVHRAKVIIDETPNFITPAQANSNWLAQTLGALKWLPNTNGKIYDGLEQLLTSITDPRHGCKSRLLDKVELDLLVLIDTDKIRSHLATVHEYALTLACGSTPTSLRTICKKTLSALEVLQLSGQVWVGHRGHTAQLNSATLHPSLRKGTGVILDGTAALYTGYGLLSPPIKIINAHARVRHYNNVVLHVARGHKAGKGYLAENAERLWAQYRPALEAALPNGERVLVCSHKEFRDKVEVGYLPGISFAHYGDIDGRNDWESYEAVALLGLPYLDAATPVNIAQALLGVQTNEWLQSSSARRTDVHDDVLTALHRGHMCSSTVQAINRVRCRNATDTLGRCKPTSVFIALPNGEDGDAVLSAIVKSMPGIQIKAWHVDAAKRKARAVPASDALFAYFVPARSGLHSKTDVRTAARIAPSSLDRIIKRMNNVTSPERERLDALGVTYYPQFGRGAESYFVKA